MVNFPFLRTKIPVFVFYIPITCNILEPVLVSVF